MTYLTANTLFYQLKDLILLGFFLKAACHVYHGDVRKRAASVLYISRLFQKHLQNPFACA